MAVAMLLVSALLAAGGVHSFSAQPPRLSPSGERIRLIIDTDIGGGGCNDVDDVVAVCIGNALTDRNEAELIAVVQNTAPLECAGAISVLNHFYGRDDMPIGAYDINTPNATLIQQQPLSYVTDIVGHFDSPIKNSTQAKDSVAVYRRVLAAQPDRSVAISSIGIHTNLAALLKSGPDNHSPLHGRELVAQKVFLLAVMGGAYPKGKECNLMGGGDQGFGLHNHYVASAASSYVAAHWPPSSKIIWSGAEVGSRVQSGGAGFQQRCPSVADARHNPCAAAMINYEKGPNKSRFSWDPLTTLVAVRGAEAVSTRECSDCDGVNVIDPTDGSNAWRAGPKSNQTYLVLLNGTRAGDDLDELLCHQSTLNPHPTPIHPAPPPPVQPQPPQPKPAGMCEVASVATAGAEPPMKGFGGGDYKTAWDGNVYTFFDYSKADGGWTEAKLTNGAATIGHIEYYPRAGYLTRHIDGGRFVGIKADKSEITLATIPSAPKLSWNPLPVAHANATASQQWKNASTRAESDGSQDVVSVKYESAPGSYGNIAEIKLYRAC